MIKINNSVPETRLNHPHFGISGKNKLHQTAIVIRVDFRLKAALNMALSIASIMILHFHITDLNMSYVEMTYQISCYMFSNVHVLILVAPLSLEN